MATDDETLATYLAEVVLFRPYDLADEQRLARLAAQGDRESRDRLVETYLDRVARIAQELAPSSMRPLDAIQEANIVVVRAIAEGLCAPDLEPELRTRVAAAFERFAQ